MYVTIRLNGRELKAMVDTGATNNFVAQGEAATLGLHVSSSTSMIKAVNSEVVHIHGMTEATLQVGSWKGVSSFMVIPFDDFKVILGLEFFVNAKVTLMPYLRGIMIGDEQNPCFVSTTSEMPGATRRMPALSAEQVEKGIKKGCATFMVALVRVEQKMGTHVENGQGLAEPAALVLGARPALAPAQSQAEPRTIAARVLKAVDERLALV